MFSVHCRHPARFFFSQLRDPNTQPLRTRSSADADKHARRVYRSVKVTKHCTIPHVRHSCILHMRVYYRRYYSALLVFYSNFVPKTFEIFDLKKCRDLENRIRGPSRSLNMSPFYRAHKYDFLFDVLCVTMALSRVLKSGSEIAQGHRK